MLATRILWLNGPLSFLSHSARIGLVQALFRQSTRRLNLPFGDRVTAPKSHSGAIQMKYWAPLQKIASSLLNFVSFLTANQCSLRRKTDSWTLIRPRDRRGPQTRFTRCADRVGVLSTTLPEIRWNSNKLTAWWQMNGMRTKSNARRLQSMLTRRAVAHPVLRNTHPAKRTKALHEKWAQNLVCKPITFQKVRQLVVGSASNEWSLQIRTGFQNGLSSILEQIGRLFYIILKLIHNPYVIQVFRIITSGAQSAEQVLCSYRVFHKFVITYFSPYFNDL